MVQEGPSECAAVELARDMRNEQLERWQAAHANAQNTIAQLQRELSSERSAGKVMERTANTLSGEVSRLRGVIQRARADVMSWGATTPFTLARVNLAEGLDEALGEPAQTRGAKTLELAEAYRVACADALVKRASWLQGRAAPPSEVADDAVIELERAYRTCAMTASNARRALLEHASGGEVA